MSRGSELLGRLAETARQARGQQPALGAELRALFRGGREDFLDAALPAFPDSARAGREPGAPGSPTQALVTADLTDRAVGRDGKDDVALEVER